MIVWDEDKNNRLKLDRKISFEEISEKILNEEYINILENPSRKDQSIFIIELNQYIYAVPFIIDQEDNIILKTAYPSRKLHKRFGGKNG